MTALRCPPVAARKISYNAESPVSPVRTRNADSRSITKILPFADLSGARRAGDRSDGIVNTVVGQRHLDLELGQEGDGVFGAAIDFGVTLLATIAAHFRHRHTGDADFGERETHGIEAMRLDDGGEKFHGPGSFLKML